MKRSLILIPLLLVSVVAVAQVLGVTLPAPSPAATISEDLGLTRIEVTYHRPGVNNRPIWGALVPYDAVWRAGANENTTVSFSTAVKVNGTDLAAGTYGLHMIPTKGDWTVIFSTQSHAWGSFSYDAAEDAARIMVKPETAPHQERLAYSFDDSTRDSAVLAMRWEKIRVPVVIKIDFARTVLANLETQLRGLPRFGWQGWNQAANFALTNDIEIEKALAFADQSLAVQRNFQNLRTKAAILDKQGNAAEANRLRAEGLTVATEADINQVGYQLIGQNDIDGAIKMFETNVKAHPESWNAYDSLAEAYATKGDKKKAITLYTKALNLTTIPAQKTRIAATIVQLKN